MTEWLKAADKLSVLPNHYFLRMSEQQAFKVAMKAPKAMDKADTPIKAERINLVDDDTMTFYVNRCSGCGNDWTDSKYKFCPHCGRRVIYDSGSSNTPDGTLDILRSQGL